MRAACHAAVLMAMALAGSAMAQTAPDVARLRLVQVVSRLPALHLYAVVEDASGTATAPSGDGFSALLGNQTLPVTVQAQPAPIAVVFLVGVSTSLRPAQFDVEKDALYDWINALGPQDRAAVMSFGNTVQVQAAFTGNKSSLIKTIAALRQTDPQTALYQGLADALTLARQPQPGVPLRRVIVIATDGVDNQMGNATRQQVADALALDPVPVYAVGVAAQETPETDAAFDDFSALTQSSGGDFRPAATLAALPQDFAALRAITQATAELTGTCPACDTSGDAASVRLVLAQPALALNSQSLTVRLVPGQDASPPPEQPAIQLPPLPPPPAPVTVSPPPVHHGLWLALAAVPLALIGLWPLLRRRQIADITYLPATTPLAAPTVALGEFLVTREIASPGAGQRLQLYPLVDKSAAPFELLFKRPIVIGRAVAPETDICIPHDSHISGRHCILKLGHHGMSIEDAGSRNGTRVNGVPITRPIHIPNDSVIGIGETELRVRLVPTGAV